MKKSFKLILFIPLLLLFIQSSCKKNKDDPKIFTYGSYQFAAKVNGQDFIPTGLAGIVSPLEISFLQGSNPANTNLYIDAYQIDKHTHVSLFIKNIKGPGHYALNTVTVGYPYQSEPPHCGMYQKDDNSGATNLWVTNSVDTGYVDVAEYKLTNNAQTNIVKGTFYFKAKSLTDGTVVEITNGYFSKN